jgi:hypothetical protein
MIDKPPIVTTSHGDQPEAPLDVRTPGLRVTRSFFNTKVVQYPQEALYWDEVNEQVAPKFDQRVTGDPSTWD